MIDYNKSEKKKNCELHDNWQLFESCKLSFSLHTPRFMASSCKNSHSLYFIYLSQWCLFSNQWCCADLLCLFIIISNYHPMEVRAMRGQIILKMQINGRFLSRGSYKFVQIIDNFMALPATSGFLSFIRLLHIIPFLSLPSPSFSAFCWLNIFFIKWKVCGL